MIVADDRKEDTDFNFWLDVVDLLSDGSPVLVIQNEKQGRSRDINFGPLRARFAGLRRSYAVNLADNRGLEDAVQAIHNEMERLPHIGAELPRTWKLVRDALERDERDYISQEQYFEICQKTASNGPRTSSSSAPTCTTSESASTSRTTPSSGTLSFSNRSGEPTPSTGPLTTRGSSPIKGTSVPRISTVYGQTTATPVSDTSCSGS